MLTSLLSAIVIDVFINNVVKTMEKFPYAGDVLLDGDN